MLTRTPDEIRAKFAQLRCDCDARGHDLLHELENACLRDNAMLEMNARMAKLENDLATGCSRMVPDLIPDRYGHLRLVDGAS
jgi:hypothetical protein